MLAYGAVLTCCVSRYVHRLVRILSVLIMIGLWVWTLGSDKCRMRRGRSGPAGRLPAPLSCCRCWGVDLREAMNVVPSPTLYVDDQYVSEALVQLLEEAEERQRYVVDAVGFVSVLRNLVVAQVCFFTWLCWCVRPVLRSCLLADGR